MMKNRVLFCLFVLLALSCTKVEKSNIPQMRVNLSLDLRYQDKDLVPLLAHKTFTSPRFANDYVGYSGVLVIHGYDDAYYAYDLCCPYEAERSITIVATDEGTAKCPKCGTVYDISYGAGIPMEGPSKLTLRRYSVIPNGKELYIQN